MATAPTRYNDGRRGNAMRLGFLLLGFCALAHGQEPSWDIFKNEKETRRPARGDEFDMALGLKGCAGFLLAPNVGASAAHCRKSSQTRVKSGQALRDGGDFDGKIG